jgi:hypothetical protein
MKKTGIATPVRIAENRLISRECTVITKIKDILFERSIQDILLFDIWCPQSVVIFPIQKSQGEGFSASSVCFFGWVFPFV